MAVEIQILSGSRQGERLTLTAPRFRVGADAGCEVWFDPQAEPAAAQRAVVFRLEDEGWLVEPLGREGLLLDQEPLTGPRHIRNGQILRLSAQGPDLMIRLVGSTQAAAAGPTASTRGVSL